MIGENGILNRIVPPSGTLDVDGIVHSEGVTFDPISEITQTPELYFYDDNDDIVCRMYWEFDDLDDGTQNGDVSINVMRAGVLETVFTTAKEVVTTGSPALSTSLATELDSSGGAITATLGDGTFIGQRKCIVMTEATTSSTVSVTKHDTSDPEVFTFDAVDEYLSLEWSGTEWVTIYSTATV